MLCSVSLGSQLKKDVLFDSVVWQTNKMSQIAKLSKPNIGSNIPKARFLGQVALRNLIILHVLDALMTNPTTNSIQKDLPATKSFGTRLTTFRAKN